jgi:pimeloyl-ACP methyl ester carboxylesterase
VKANGLELEYDTFGDAGAAPLLLVMGLGAQMISWDDEFCAMLAARGFHVTRFDNRDVGLSTKLDHLGVPDPYAIVGGTAEPAYRLEDLAADAVGVLDGVGVEAAHVVGASMGGFVAQFVAIGHPERVLSLTSIMSAPGGMRDNAPPTQEAAEALMARPPEDRDALIEHGVWVSSRIHGPRFFDADDVRRKRTLAVDRCVSTSGTARQLGAIAAASSRAEALGRLTMPALVIHGEVDPLVRLDDGRKTAEAIPGARLLVLEGAGHDLPRAHWPQIVAAIGENARRADPRVPAEEAVPS